MTNILLIWVCERFPDKKQTYFNYLIWLLVAKPSPLAYNMQQDKTIGPFFDAIFFI